MQFFAKRYHPPGTPPGTLRTEADLGLEPPSIHLLDYSRHEILELAGPDLHKIGDRL